MFEHLRLPLTPLALGPMHWVFIIPICLLSVFLTLLILVQRGRGGGLTGALGGMGGQSAFGAKAGDLFTKITIVTAMIWILLGMGALKVLHKPRFGSGVTTSPTPPANAPADPTKPGTSTTDPTNTSSGTGITPENSPPKKGTTTPSGEAPKNDAPSSAPAPAEPPAAPATPPAPATPDKTDE